MYNEGTNSWQFRILAFLGGEVKLNAGHLFAIIGLGRHGFILWPHRTPCGGDFMIKKQMGGITLSAVRLGENLLFSK